MTQSLPRVSFSSETSTRSNVMFNKMVNPVYLVVQTLKIPTRYLDDRLGVFLTVRYEHSKILFHYIYK